MPRRQSARNLTLAVALLLPLALLAPPARAGAEAGKTVTAANGMVVSVSAPATDVGVAVLKRGGNAVDAAVATAFALAVTFPEAGNIGGGGFMLVHPPAGRPVVVEYREKAPLAATREMYAEGASGLGHKVVGVPGTVAGLALAHEKFGKLPWKDLVLPAVRLARDGFPLDGHVAASLNLYLLTSKDFPEFCRVYGRPGGAAWEAGDRLTLPDLADTLEAIAEGGPKAFYEGGIADRLAAEMKDGGGIITKEDLKRYTAQLREPVHGVYRGYDVYGPPPPSSGGTCLVEMLRVLENFDLKKYGRWSPVTNHVMIEAMRRAYRDRARYLGDPDFVKVPAKLTSEAYARDLAAGIDLTKATRSADLAGDIQLAPGGDSTTHFSVVDKDGMAVANTFTLEQSYGARVVVKGAGFLLNNEMGDFNWRPGYTDRKGAIGTEANTIAPGKRMLSSMCPTIIAKDGKPFLVTGSPGGRTIINTVLCVTLNVVEFQMDVRSAVDAPRMHHAWFPDETLFEGAEQHSELVDRLRAMGHRIRPEGKQGDAHTILIDPATGRYHGAADMRRSGKAAGY